MRKRFNVAATTLVLLGLTAGLAACGGGKHIETAELSIRSEDAVDGFVTDTALVDTISDISAGDTDADFQMVARGFVRFSLSEIPAGATLVSAEIRMHQKIVVGTPYASHGDVFLDHVDIGAALDAQDFNAIPLQALIGALSLDATLGVKMRSVTQQVQADIAAGRTTSDFRLRFQAGSNSDGVSDFASFQDGLGSLDTAAALTVIYQP